MKPTDFTQKSYDAVVVGARAAGAATAMLMAQQGANVLMIDWDEPGSDTMSTHALMRGGVMQLSRWGLLDRVVAAGTPAITETSFFYDRDPIRFAIKPQHGVGALYAPRRYVLDAVLVDGARRAGVEVAFRTAFRDVIRDADGRVTGAWVETAGGQRMAVSCDLLIGADGRRSTVARRVEAKTEHLSRHATSCVYAYYDGIPQEGNRWYYAPDLAAGAIPTNNGQTCVFVSVRRDRFVQQARNNRPEQMIADVAAEIDMDLGRQVAQATLAERPVSFVGQKGHIRRSWGEGWALVGDAGYFKDPLTAHGITDALRDAEILANAAMQGSTDALQTYQALRDALSMDLFQITDRVASFDWTLPELQALHKELSRAMNAEQDWMAANFATPALAA